MTRALRRLAFGLLCLSILAVAGVIGVLAWPQTLHAHSASHGRLSLHSDTAFDMGAGISFLADVERRIAAAPLELRAADVTWRIVISNTEWRRRLTFLDEIAHGMVTARIGALARLRLPVWIEEGLADYVAFNGEIDLAQLARGFREGRPDLDPAASGLYGRYHLGCALSRYRELERRRSFDGRNATGGCRAAVQGTSALGKKKPDRIDPASYWKCPLRLNLQRGTLKGANGRRNAPRR